MGTKDKSDTLEAHVLGVEELSFKHETVRTYHLLEHELTIKDAFNRHPALIWWSFYWLVAGVGWGFDAQVNGGMLSVESFRRDFGYIYDREAALPADWQTAFNTVSSVGQFFGGFLCAWLADRIGRKRALFVGVAIVTAGILGEIFSTARAAFAVSKLILGFDLGFYLTLAPLATSECAPVVFRGGISTAGFRRMDIPLGIPSSLCYATLYLRFSLGLLPFAPETPWCLARVGKREEAKRSLCKLYGSGVDIDAKWVALEATIVEEEAAKYQQGSIIQCFRGTDRIRTAISTGVFACQHFVGIIFVTGYSTYFFQLAGLPPSKSFDLGVGVTACGLLGNIFSWFIVNSLGCRKIFTSGMVLMTTILFFIGILDVIHTSAAKWVQAALTAIYAFVYFTSLGAMAFTIVGEASSTSLRAPTMALATGTQAIMGIIFNFTIYYMINPDEGHLRGKVGFIFGGLATIATAWSFFYIPELKGRTF
ncbi:General alpha-glucoside permease [Metarhizium brunneum]|uniref:General alpha-glucoside permease n=1 Tax=Metarhizium brunneum TaxID=500148 RepID=A0A7D5UPY8_9HYPO